MIKTSSYSSKWQKKSFQMLLSNLHRFSVKYSQVKHVQQQANFSICSTDYSYKL